MADTFINMTGKEIKMVGTKGETILILPAANTPATVTTRFNQTDTLNDVPVVEKVYAPIQNLPDAATDTWYIVTQEVAQAGKLLPTPRVDLLVPADEYRTDRGQLLGYQKLLQV